ncbi:MAG: hypothetical protein V4655_02970 [Bdellovibrionota bacterium]
MLSVGTVPSVGAGVVVPGTELVESGLPGISLVVGATSEGAGVVASGTAEGAVVVEVAESVAVGVFFVQATLSAKAAEAKRIFFIIKTPKVNNREGGIVK